MSTDRELPELAVKLRLLVDTDYNHGTAVGNAEYSGEQFWEPHGNNPYAATRCAIVRAAAEIGRNMK